MHRNFKIGISLALSSGIVYGLTSVAFKYGIDAASYGSLVTDKVFWLAIAILVVAWIFLFTNFKSDLFKIAFIVSLIYIILFLVFEISLLAVVLLIIAFLLAIFALSHIDASIAWPLTGCKYIVCSLAAYFLLSESLTFLSIFGAVLILLGSTFLITTSGNSGK